MTDNCRLTLKHCASPRRHGTASETPAPIVNIGLHIGPVLSTNGRKGQFNNRPDQLNMHCRLQGSTAWLLLLLLDTLRNNAIVSQKRTWLLSRRLAWDLRAWQATKQIAKQHRNTSEVLEIYYKISTMAVQWQYDGSTIAVMAVQLKIVMAPRFHCNGPVMAL